MAAIHHPLGGIGRPLGVPVRGLRINLGLIAALAFLLFAALLPVLQNSFVTSQGFDIQASQRQQARLRAEISLLEADVARLTSQARIERRAQEIGMVRAADPVFITVQEPGPAPAKLPAEYLPAPEPKPAPAEPWWKSLLSWRPW
ncbi:septum formation initiator family protein [Tepidiforma thermophila]|uniref:Cell division protein FtsB n=1 Tax=Tepidiforma thermophila (strain KCTC 52669 / CGMCC 1.13589 / G233) TaxID=2761530 RepID=A0A2A9HGI1_TEPT2|nr:septum formation initiator family protein [Tepidiforma thermophila]PFG74200.1 cell division protein FtsB [Tepidiforma thermophila]